MPGKKVSAMTELAATPATSDELYIRDVSELAASESKRITVANLLEAVSDIDLGHVSFPATQEASAGANDLDDYEEGTWTMTILFGGAEVGNVYSSQAGRYTKVGRLVTVYGAVFLSTKGSSTGSATIGGLPFTSANSGSGVRVGGGLRCSDMSFADHPQWDILQNSAAINLREITNAGALTSLDNTNFTNSTQIMVGISYEV